MPVATLLLSEGPDYGAAVVRTTLVAWLIAGSGRGRSWPRSPGGSTVGASPGHYLPSPAASNGMAHGDLTVRAEVDRADEIGALADSFNAMAEKNQATVTALRRFVADAAHEIGTPLTALQADLELAKDSAGRGRPGSG